MLIEAFLPQLEKGNCPSPSQSTLALMDLLQKEDASLDEAARLIRLDPILVAKTIKLANSPIYRLLATWSGYEGTVVLGHC
ncbi:HDOD domain-containing protein [Acidithiobacillus sp. HP-11]|uniref:HDOD domain-containing protein n=1 Tax=Acidithiobacillus sp. HP-11 TaxID=2697656 RepID=UPI001879A1F8|nr:HDOD domain-containing protein [Acidithiobacillus sp. HP-11]MBE7567384.1 HDOD domain-containing protein [Acidithiobacillus sp. HP-11]